VQCKFQKVPKPFARFLEMEAYSKPSINIPSENKLGAQIARNNEKKRM
jgi:hypothetical protein